jgi:hypothetical protein
MFVTCIGLNIGLCICMSRLFAGCLCWFCRYGIFFKVFLCLPFFCVLLLLSYCLIPYLCNVLSMWVEYAELPVYVLLVVLRIWAGSILYIVYLICFWLHCTERSRQLELCDSFSVANFMIGCFSLNSVFLYTPLPYFHFLPFSIFISLLEHALPEVSLSRWQSKQNSSFNSVM